MLRHNLMGPTEQLPQPTRRTTYDWFKDFVLPLALAGIGIAKGEALWYIGAAAFLLVALLVGAAPPVARAVRHWLARARDNKRVREGQADFRRFVARLGEFVDLNRRDRLEDIVNQAITRIPAAQGRGLMAPQRVFYTMWHLLDRRTAVTPKDVAAAVAYCDEFYTVLNEFHREHVWPIYERLPQDIGQGLDQAAKRDLNAYREQFNGFCDDYNKWIKQFLSSLESVKERVPSVEHLKPLA